MITSVLATGPNIVAASGICVTMHAGEAGIKGATGFQEECRTAVDAVLAEFGMETLYQTHETSKESHGPGGSFLRGCLGG